MTDKLVLALDQGTTSSRAILFNRSGHVVATSQQEFRQILPSPGHVEHDAEEIWQSQMAVAQDVLQQSGTPSEAIAAIGITNQRETTILWDRHTGKPVDNAIVWQSRITAPICDKLRAEGLDAPIRAKTGLILDAYFSGTKIRYLLDKHPDLQAAAQRGDILFGTVDSFLIWRLTGGKIHATDVTNACRTMLFDIHRQDWDDELLQALRIPRAMLPTVVDSSGLIGECSPDHFGKSIPIAGCAGDQQAALFGQACFQPGMAKNTYGTGCFMLMNTGEKAVESENRLLTSIAWRRSGVTNYCLEGSVFIAGAVVQWLRDGLGLIKSSADIEQLAATVEDNGGVYFVPAFVGLGAPHWDPDARGSIFGITRGTTAGHVARAALESMAFQTRDVLSAMQKDAKVTLEALQVDGGASVNNDFLQFQADVLDCPVRRPQVTETTALGAAYLAGLAVGYWDSTDDVTKNWALDREFTPQWEEQHRQALCKKWDAAVTRSLAWEV
ncbi:MAG: glycerol kinase GlpK [Planctomycetales bacterium]|nr:glycerol kinase GlpK [Planctomycetales bacterium]